jgi:DNA-binding NarL/FixJ family response regulator
MIKKILLVEDHMTTRRGTRAIVEEDSNFKVVAETGLAAEALDRVRALQPDVVILDISLPDGSGLSVIQDILTASHGRTQVIVLTMHREEPYVLNALGQGAKGYILKDLNDDLLEAVRAVLRGETYLSKPIVALAIKNYVQQATTSGGAIALLSPREKHILNLIGRSRSSKEIAEQLGISERTVETHRHNIIEKLGLSSTPRAIQAFVQQHANDLADTPPDNS